MIYYLFDNKFFHCPQNCPSRLWIRIRPNSYLSGLLDPDQDPQIRITKPRIWKKYLRIHSTGTSHSVHLAKPYTNQAKPHPDYHRSKKALKRKHGALIRNRLIRPPPPTFTTMQILLYRASYNRLVPINHSTLNWLRHSSSQTWNLQYTEYLLCNLSLKHPL